MRRLPNGEAIFVKSILALLLVAVVVLSLFVLNLSNRASQLEEAVDGLGRVVLYLYMSEPPNYGGQAIPLPGPKEGERFHH